MAKREKFSIWGREPDTKTACLALYQSKKRTWPPEHVLNKEDKKYVLEMMDKYYYSPLKPEMVQDVFHSVKDKITEIKVTYHEIYGLNGSTRLEFWVRKPTFDDPGKMYPFSVARCICFPGQTGLSHESALPKVAVKKALRNAIADEKIDWKKSKGYRAGIDPLKHAHHVEGKEFQTIYLKFLDAIKITEDEFIDLIYPEHGNFETNHVVYSEDGTDWKFKDTERGLKINAAFFEFHYRNREYEMMDPKPHAKLTADETKFNTSIRHKIKEKITDEL